MNIRRHIFEFILDQRTRWNQMPTQSQVRQMFAGWSDDLDLHLEQLEREGLLTLGKDEDDSISLVPTFPYAQQIGLRVGSAKRLPRGDGAYTAGCIALDLRGAGVEMEDELFALLVGDDSMSDAGIRADDIAILKTGYHQRGDIVAVPMFEQLVLRRYVSIAGIPHLLAENPLRPELVPAFEQNFHGVLWGLIRTEPSRRICRVASHKVNYCEDATMTPEQRLERILSPFLNSADEENARSSPASLRSKAKKKTVATRWNSGKKSNSGWPKPPSGLGLNDKAANCYRLVSQPVSMTDERPDRKYDQARTDALAGFIRWRDSGYKEPLKPEQT